MAVREKTQKPEIASQIAFPWIVRLRYGLAAGQAITALVAVYGLSLNIPLAWVLLGPLFVVVSNRILAREIASPNAAPRRIATPALITWIFFLDTICLTGLLMLSGGPSNPFTLLYLVHITLAATILTTRQTWALGLFSIGCFALLFQVHYPVPQLGVHHHGELHFTGMWISFAVAVLLVALYASKISSLLRDHEASMRQMQEELARKDRLASLVTLAAGAAHELSTPLATIAVVAKELEHFANKTPLAASVGEDSRLIRQEVDRCRGILQRMSADGAEPAGEQPQIVDVKTLLEFVRLSFPHGSVRATVDNEISPSLHIPRRAVEQALVALVKNAIEASPVDTPVEIHARSVGNYMQFQVLDQGGGMNSEMLRRVGEPFFTTKPPGQGMGLGVFLTRTLAERLGGNLSFHSNTPGGSCAVLELPLPCAEISRSPHALFC